MDLKKYFLSLIFFATTSFLMFSQEQSIMERVEIEGRMPTEAMALVGALFNQSLSLSDERSGESRFSHSGNQVFIQQIGANNTVNTNISSGDALVNLKQDGYGNDIQVQITANEVKYDFIQTGDNNRFFHFAHSPSQPIKVKLSQDGNNNHVEKYGSNSITNKLEFNIQGNSKALIIRSYQ